MNKFKKTIAICLILLLALCVCLSACNKDDKKDSAKERAQAVSNVENAFMSGVADGWTSDLSQDVLIERADAGDYLVTLGWTRMICDVIGESSLQTGKIQSLANALSSEDGKKLLADFEGNAELLIPLLKDVGFTPSDISALVYDLMCAMASKGADTIDSIRTQLLSLIERMRRDGITGDSADNVSKNYVLINEAKSAFVPTEQEKQEMLASFKDAQGALNQLVSFAYNMSINAITDELYGKLFDESGALGSITQSELSTLVGTVLDSVQMLSDALTQDEIAHLNNALNLVIENFDKEIVSSPIYAQIVKYAKYAYMVIDIVPTICDGVIAGGDILSDADFIADLLKVSAIDKEYDGANDEAVLTRLNDIILIARVITQVLNSEDFSEQRLTALVDQIGAQSIDEYQKAVPLFLVDVLLNFSTIYEQIEESESNVWNIIHDDVMTQDALSSQLTIVLFFNTYFDKFKDTYYKYTKGEATAGELAGAFNACSFSRFIDTQNNVYTQYTEEWYTYYVTVGLNAVNEKVATIMRDNVIPDLKAFVKDYYAQGSSMKSAMDLIANMDIIEVEDFTEDTLQSLMPTLKDSCLLGVTLLTLLGVL